MADEGTNVAAQPAEAAGQPTAGTTQTGGGGGGFNLPAGHRLIPETDYERMTRAEQQARGMQGFYTKASEYGLKRAEDFDNWGPVLKFGKPDVLRQILEGGGGGEQEQGQKPEFDPEKFEKGLMSKFERQQAEREWRQQLASERQMVDKFLASMPDLDETEKEMYRHAITGRLEADRQALAWPEGHPLAGDRLPAFTEEAAKPVFDWVATARSKAKGVALAKIGDAAAQGAPRSTPAGDKGGQGKPEDDDHTANPLKAAHARMRNRVGQWT